MRRIAVLVSMAMVATIAGLAGGASSPVGAGVCDKIWANPSASGFWDQTGVANGTETQWSPAGVPGASDVVCLPGGAYAVTITNGDAAAYTIEHLSIGSPTGPQPSFQVRTGKTLTVTGSVSQTGGRVTIVGDPTPPFTEGTLVADDYAIAGGDLDGGGTLTTDLNNNAGRVTPGNDAFPGDTLLSLNGSYFQTLQGTYHVDIDGQQNGINQSHMHVTGTADLNGTIEIDMTVVPSPPAIVMIANGGMTGPPPPFNDSIGGPASWVAILGSGVETMRIAPSPSFSDVPFSHTFFFDVEWLASMDITGGFPDGTYRPSNAVTRASMAAFLYRLVGAPAYTPPMVPTFNDVPTDHTFYKEIEWLNATGITGGFPDGGFHPSAAVTRGSMAAFLYRLAGEPTFTPPGTPTFDDVPSNHTFFKEIEWLVSEDVTGGFPDDTYRPSLSVSRGSMAAFLHRYVDQGLPTEPPDLAPGRLVPPTRALV